MVALSTLKCLVTPVMILNIVVGIITFIVWIGYTPAFAIGVGGFYMAAGIFGFIGMKPGKKWAFVVFVSLETLLSIACIIDCVYVYDDPSVYDDFFLVYMGLISSFIICSTIFGFMFLFHPDSNQQVFQQVIVVQQPLIAQKDDQQTFQNNISMQGQQQYQQDNQQYNQYSLQQQFQQPQQGIPVQVNNQQNNQQVTIFQQQQQQQQQFQQQQQVSQNYPKLDKDNNA